MLVAVVLPMGEIPIELIAQQLEGVKAHFPSPAELRYFCHGGQQSHYDQSLSVRTEAMDSQFVACDELVILQAFGEERAAQLRVPNTTRTSYVGWEGRLLPLRRSMDDRDLQNMDCHVFNRLSPPEAWGFYYFPFNYLFRYAGMGPIDKFGFRITRSLAQLAGRSSNVKVVACFGGSACWSPYALHHQMHTELLEQRLNGHCSRNGLDLSFVVLNVGQHGNMVMNEMLNYMLFCHEVKPDIVVAHDGYNDLVYGQMCDPRLLSESLAYQENLEGWSQLLHNTSQHPRTQNELPYRAVNAPIPVLKAYTKRKRQFADIVTRSGALFVWGLQPAAFSKKRRPKVEADLVARMFNRDYAPVVANVESMYATLLKSLRVPEGIPFVDCHTVFGKYGEERFLLGDDVHLVAGGDALLAEIYGDAIIRSYIDAGRWQMGKGVVSGTATQS